MGFVLLLQAISAGKLSYQKQIINTSIPTTSTTADTRSAIFQKIAIKNDPVDQFKFYKDCYRQQNKKNVPGDCCALYSPADHFQTPPKWEKCPRKMLCALQSFP